MSNRDGPIGVFDSGVGGLSILLALLRQLPSEDYYYLADEAHCPYGSRAAQQIKDLSASIAGHLISLGAKMVVVACNTASTVALDYLRQTYPNMRFVGIVPAVKPAASLTQSGVIGVLATPNTLHSHIYHELLEDFASDTQVISRACHGLVEQVEAGELESHKTMGLLRRYVEPMIEGGADTIVLGCTHYPFLIPALRHIVGDEINVIEPSMAIARQAGRVLARDGLARHSHMQGRLVCATTGDAIAFGCQLRKLLDQDSKAAQLVWVDGQISIQSNTVAKEDSREVEDICAS